MIDIVVAARRELIKDADVIAKVGSSQDWDHWIFRWNSYVSVEGTGSVAVVLRQNGAWSGANRHNTARFPRLQVAIYADPDRTTKTLQPKSRTPYDKVQEAFVPIDKILHRPDGGEISWGDGSGTLRIVSSSRAFGDLEIVEVPDGDGMVRGLMEYDITLG